MHTDLSSPLVVVIGTGGTIAGRSTQPGNDLDYRAAALPVGALLEGVALPEGLGVQVLPLAQIDSKDMGVPVWQHLLAEVQRQLQRPEVVGVVVTHGTDTLEETAYLLHAVLGPRKPVVLASAMRPANSPQADGPGNLADALTLAAWPGASGVLVVCAGRVHSGLDVRKEHNHRLDAFGSGEAGPLGVLGAGRWTPWRPWPQGAEQADCLDRLLATPVWPRVEWLTSHGGADGAVVEALLAQRDRQRQDGVPEERLLRGLLVAGTGNGTLHQRLAEVLAVAQVQGVRVWRSTRCAQGSVRVGQATGIPACPLPPAKARLALMLHLVQHPC